MFDQVPPATTHVTLCPSPSWAVCAMLQALGDFERLNDGDFGDFSDGGSAQEAEDPEEPWLWWRCMVWMVGKCRKSSISISEWFLWKIIYQGIYRRILREDPRFCHFPNEKSTTWEIYRDIFLIFGRCGWANPRRGLATWWMMPMPSFWRTAGPADSWGAGIGE